MHYRQCKRVGHVATACTAGPGWACGVCESLLCKTYLAGHTHSRSRACAFSHSSQQAMSCMCMVFQTEADQTLGLVTPGQTPKGGPGSKPFSNLTNILSHCCAWGERACGVLCSGNVCVRAPARCVASSLSPLHCKCSWERVESVITASQDKQRTGPTEVYKRRSPTVTSCLSSYQAGGRCCAPVGATLLVLARLTVSRQGRRQEIAKCIWARPAVIAGPLCGSTGGVARSASTRRAPGTTRTASFVKQRQRGR